jgi:penicillin G amidase
VLSDVQKSHADLLDTRKYVIALRWSALDADNQTVLAGLRSNLAQSTDDLLADFSAYHSPTQNVVAADVAGQVAFKVVGKIPLRQPGNDIRGLRHRLVGKSATAGLDGCPTCKRRRPITR